MEDKITAEDMIERLGLEQKPKFSLHVVMWRLSCLIIVPLSLIIVLFRLIQFGGMNYKYYFLDPDKSLIGKWFYKWLANAT